MYRSVSEILMSICWQKNKYSLVLIKRSKSTILKSTIVLDRANIVLQLAKWHCYDTYIVFFSSKYIPFKNQILITSSENCLPNYI